MALPGREGYLNIISMIRPINGVITSAGVWIGWAVATGDPFNITLPLLLSILSSVLILGGGNIFNDIEDMEIDKKIHPERPLPSGSLSRKKMAMVGLLLWISGIILTSAVCLMVSSVLPIVILIIVIVFLLVYEKWTKKEGLLGNITVSIMTGIPFLFGSSLTGRIPVLIVMFSLMACFINLSRELFKDIQDMEGDSLIRRSFPIIYSKERAIGLARISTISGVALSYIVILVAGFEIMYLVLITISNVLFFSGIFRNIHDIDGSVEILKTGMGVALISFFIWSIV